ncbi:MAG: hypothetical protein Q8K72_12305 [Acidimicrobiales bacterium]|nr:hypothetical protein [Acidimicrobiales bacterium]
MTIRHCPNRNLCFATSSERDDHVATDHETLRQGPERAEAVPAGAVAER